MHTVYKAHAGQQCSVRDVKVLDRQIHVDKNVDSRQKTSSHIQLILCVAILFNNVLLSHVKTSALT